jgi:hypothetical protein
MGAICSLINSMSKSVLSMSVSQKGHFRLSALSHLTVSLICLPHLEHVISSGKLSKNMVLFSGMNKTPLFGKFQTAYS